MLGGQRRLAEGSAPSHHEALEEGQLDSGAPPWQHRVVIHAPNNQRQTAGRENPSFVAESRLLVVGDALKLRLNSKR